MNRMLKFICRNVGQGLLTIAVASLAISNVAALEWSVQKVVSSGVNGKTSLAVDVNDHPHIVYPDSSNPLTDFDLKYVSWNGSQWNFETIDSGSGNWGSYTSLALDSFGVPHVAYGHGGSGVDPFAGPRYAMRNSSGWVTETVPTSQATGQYTALALDSLNRPSITYSGSQYDLEIATKPGTNWTRTKVRDVSDVVGYTSVAIGTNNLQQIAYAHRSDESINYAAWTGRAWVFRPIQSGGINSASEVAIDLDSKNTPFVAYSRYGPTLAVWQNTFWQTETIESVWAWSISLVVDKFDQPHLVYFDRDHSLVKYATRQGGIWKIEVIDSGWYNGQGASIGIDSQQRVHISWYDSADYSLKYALGTPVPEPSTMGFAAISILFSITRRRRERPCCGHYF